MIARLSGTVIGRALDHVVLDVGGVGYRVFVSTATLGEVPSVGEPCVLRIHTQVRDDAIHLFGFATEVECEMFRTLIKLSGIGPKNAIQILSGLPVPELVRAIASADVDRLVKVPGVGRRTAERLVMELKDRIEELGRSADPAAREPASGNGNAGDTLDALMRLGLPRQRAERAVRDAGARLAPDATLELWIRESLRLAGNG